MLWSLFVYYLDYCLYCIFFVLILLKFKVNLVQGFAKSTVRNINM